MAFLVVLESMTPAERVAFVLHDVSRHETAPNLTRAPRWRVGHALLRT
jgi:hypothetical protein